MNGPHSFRWRLLLGTALWSLGLIPLLHLLFLVAHRQLHRFIAPWGIAVFLVVAFVCIAAGIWQYRAGLLPFGRLRQQLLNLRDGSTERIEGIYPTEVQPLVNDLNLLLEQRARTVKRALTKAGDLAHGLKTPLAVLAQEAEQFAAAGDPETASRIGAQVDRMRRQVEYHLTQARATTPGNLAGARCSVLTSVEGLARALEKIYATRGLTIEVRVSPEHFIRGQREDLEEILGNLLDNACKWAKSVVKIESLAENDSVILIVDDDGPGLPSSMRDEVLKRGVRADEAAPGSGLGLAIVRDLVQLYEGALTLEESPLRGLRARVRLPS
jgi:signal transduction histidine kinase